MIKVMNQITDKPGWDRKVFDDAVTEKWRQEARDAGDLDVTETMLDWVSQFFDQPMIFLARRDSEKDFCPSPEKKHNSRCVYGYNVSSGDSSHASELLKSKRRYKTLYFPRHGCLNSTCLPIHSTSIFAC